ncbi:MAG: 2,3-bisphosphoglycerate-independent phosphoglycerate mutase [Parcubacteria group bacterium]|jgi:2,3-bisphosphoglycerate-independent phosphoglycerate mutase
MKSPTLLIILDGYGIAAPSKYNAITLAKKPTLDRLFELYPNTLLGATGQDVGLLDNKMSGSEAGHMNIGAGRIVPQDSYYVSKSIKDGSFFMNPALVGAVHHAKNNHGKFHVMGLMSDTDSPHSDPEHFRAILKLAKENGIEEVYCHLFSDGRDSYPKSALTHLQNFRKIMSEEGIGKIASISGRFYAMDRAKNWDRLAMAYEAIVFGRGRIAQSAEEAINNAYKKGRTDEYIKPTVIMENGKPVAKIEKNDSIVFFNLRSDRARQFSKLFVANNKSSIITDDMPILDKIRDLYFVALTNFGPDLDVHTVWSDQTLAGTLPMVLADFRQFYIAESEKYAHITYFFNGGYADPVNGEERLMIPSPKIDSYAKIPQMAAHHIKDHVLDSLENDLYDFYAINFANADMVGHTGDLAATVKAVEFIDEQIKEMAEEVIKRNGNLIITADHGNAECMFDAAANQPNTFHTKNPVPFLLASDKFKGKKLSSDGVLGNIAPTILEIMETEKPKAMDKNSLLK